ncbi:MAG: TlpA family protein disulfide reductase, partial [Prevotella sp.]|nr:TlpA family protein disulfide reductase [Prevotella sp.]
MRKVLFGLVMIAMTAGCANGSNKQQEQNSASQQGTRVEAPDFELNDINGKPLKLSSLRGKYVVLDFWGAWCRWCIKGIPEMKEAY